MNRHRIVSFQLVRRVLSGCFFLPMILLLGGCTLDTRMSTFVTKGPVAETQYDLFMITVWVTLFIFIAVGGAYLFVVLKFREKPGDDRPLPTQSHGNPFDGLTVFLFFACDHCCADRKVSGIRTSHQTLNPQGWVIGTMVRLYQKAKRMRSTIRVLGYQWWWEFEYPQLGVTTANESIPQAGAASPGRRHSLFHCLV